MCPALYETAIVRKLQQKRHPIVSKHGRSRFAGTQFLIVIQCASSPQANCDSGSEPRTEVSVAMPGGRNTLAGTSFRYIRRVIYAREVAESQHAADPTLLLGLLLLEQTKHACRYSHWEQAD